MIRRCLFESIAFRVSFSSSGTRISSLVVALELLHNTSMSQSLFMTGGTAAVVVVLLAGGFLKCFTTLQIFRLGLGLYSSTVGIIVLLFSLVFAFFVVDSATPVSIFSRSSDFATVQKQVTPVIEANTDAEEIEKLRALQERLQKRFAAAGTEAAKDSQEVVSPKEESVVSSNSSGDGFSVLLLGFLLTELKIAFQLGLLFIVPFVVIDLLVVHVMQLLQVQQLSAAAFSLPLKLLLFIAVDGWSLMTQRFIVDYAGS